jgi:uncharacterized cupredoxin-like copper-binding protein
MPPSQQFLALFWLVLLTGWLLPLEVSPADSSQEDTVTVLIRERQFQPAESLLHAGQKTKLVFKNEDSELHTFAPSGLFSGESFNISGNGAPEFYDEGLKRVIIPPDGVVEIRFTPTKPGQYRYICDMPGHHMSAILKVE